jgi:hypothetical protein
MSAEELLNAMDELFGNSPLPGLSQSSMVRQLRPPEVPVGWQSRAADRLQQTSSALEATGAVFAATDDEIKGRVDVVSEAVRDGKAKLAAIREDYRINRARLLAFANDPEVAARLAQLDRVRVQDGSNTVQSTQATLAAVMTTRTK